MIESRLALLALTPSYATEFNLYAHVESTAQHLAMARSKQATPVRRQTSSEYFSKQDLARTPSNGAAKPNGKADSVVAPAAHVETREAGALQILIAVGGIYASLYVKVPIWRETFLV